MTAGTRVRVTYVRSLGQSTERDLTAPVPTAVEGELVRDLAEGVPIAVQRRGKPRPWTTTPADRVELGRTVAEVWTRRSVYRVQLLEGR